MTEIVLCAYMDGFTLCEHSALVIKKASFCPYKQIQVCSKVTVANIIEHLSSNTKNFSCNLDRTEETL